MSMPVPAVIVKAFAADAAPAYRTFPIPTDSQIPVTPGAASLTDGFPPLNMTAPASGGIPPAGKDMNGVLFMATGGVAYQQAGGLPKWSAAIVAEQIGYGVGAVVQSAVTPLLFFMNTVADNANNPDSVITGWIAFTPVTATLYQLWNPAAGPNNNFALATGVGFFDVNPISGSITLSGMAAGYDGQEVTITNIHASNSVTLLALSGGSLAINQFRMAADLTLLQYGCVTFKYSSALTVWVQL